MINHFKYRNITDGLLTQSSNDIYIYIYIYA